MKTDWLGSLLSFSGSSYMMKKSFASPSHSLMAVVWMTTISSSQSRESAKYFQLKFNLWYGKHSASHISIFPLFFSFTYLFLSFLGETTYWSSLKITVSFLDMFFFCGSGRFQVGNAGGSGRFHILQAP